LQSPETRRSTRQSFISRRDEIFGARGLLKNAGGSGRLIIKDAVFLITGPPRPIQNSGELTSNPDFDYSLNFPGSRLDPRIRDWSSMFNLSVRSELAGLFYMKSARRLLASGGL
jgi:hypothetical protein